MFLSSAHRGYVHRLRGAKYRSDKYVRELHTYTLTLRAAAQVGGRRDLPHSDVYGCYYVLTDAVVSHIEVHTANTRCRAPPGERCRPNGYAGACNARCNYTSAGEYGWCAGAHEPLIQAGAWICLLYTSDAADE